MGQGDAGEHTEGSLMGIGTGTPGADYTGLRRGQEPVLGKPDLLPERLSRRHPAVLQAPGHVHGGSENQCGGLTVSMGGLLADPGQYFVFPLLVEHRQPPGRLIVSDLQGAVQAPAQQV